MLLQRVNLWIWGPVGLRPEGFRAPGRLDRAGYPAWPFTMLVGHLCWYTYDVTPGVAANVWLTIIALQLTVLYGNTFSGLSKEAIEWSNMGRCMFFFDSTGSEWKTTVL